MDPETAVVTAPGAAIADGVAVLLFAAVGRRSHAESGAVLGVLATAGPFLAGTAAAWAFVPRVRRLPGALLTGELVALVTVAVGMLVRHVLGQGTAGSFVVVATVVTSCFLVGWRAVAAASATRRRRAGTGRR